MTSTRELQIPIFDSLHLKKEIQDETTMLENIFTVVKNVVLHLFHIVNTSKTKQNYTTKKHRSQQPQSQ